MTNLKSCVSACRYCRYYTPQGSRGGICQLLSVSVKSEWKACSLSAPSFIENHENMASTPSKGLKTASVVLSAE